MDNFNIDSITDLNILPEGTSEQNWESFCLKMLERSGMSAEQWLEQYGSNLLSDNDEY